MRCVAGVGDPFRCMLDMVYSSRYLLPSHEANPDLGQLEGLPENVKLVWRQFQRDAGVPVANRDESFR